jgi:cysteine desulfurase
MAERIYLDNAATTPLDTEVYESMIEVMRENYGNPSSTNAHGRKAKGLIEDARLRIAKLLNCPASEIFFTSGGTEADNIAIRSSINSLGLKRVITSPIEHHAVLYTVQSLAQAGSIEMQMVELDKKGHVNLNHLEELLQQGESKTLVSLMHANNEIGNLLDIKRAGKIIHEHGALFHCDAVQSMGHYPFDLSAGYVDFLAAAAHKFNGPKGIGFLYVNKNNRLKPLITGGSQEREMRGGTENVYGIVGMAKALEICYRDMEAKRTHIENLKQKMMQLLMREIPDVRFNGDPEGNSLYTVLSVSLPHNEVGNMLLFNLDIDGISASSGSACSSGSNLGSHVIQAIEPNSDRTTVRFSFGKYNTEAEIEKTVATLGKWYAVPEHA